MSIEAYSTSIARTHFRRYFPDKDVGKYAIATAKPGMFQIWYGNGNNGKSKFCQILELALFRHEISYTDFIPHPDDVREGTRCVVICDPDTHGDDIDCGAIERLLDKDIFVLAMVNSIPKLRHPSGNLLARTHVIPFVSRFSDTHSNPEEYVFLRDLYVPHALIAQYVIERSADWTDAKRPHTVENLRNDLLTKAIYAPAPAPAPVPAPVPTPTLNVLCLPEDVPELESVPAGANVVEEPHQIAAGDARYLPIRLTFKTTDLPDDELMIEPDPESDGFIVTYDQPTTDSHSVAFINDVATLKRYLEIFLMSITWSSEGYKNVHMDVPHFAHAVLDAKTNKNNMYMSAIHYARANLFRQIDFLCEDWPVTFD